VDDVARADAAVFSAEGTRRTLVEACDSVELPSGGAELIRLGENAIYRLWDVPVVVRIARTVRYLPTVRREVAVARWLASAGLPAARVVESVDQALVVGERVVTFWELIENTEPEPSIAELGATLRRLHGLPVPDGLGLPEVTALGRALERIEVATFLDDADRSFLRSRALELEAAFADLRFALPPAALHGDAHAWNLMRDPTGTIRLIDFEAFAYGPPECDLVVTASGYRLFDDITDPYEDFVNAYGFDVTAWDGFDVLQQVNELKMTTWLMQNVNEDPAIAAEFRKRLADLRNPSAPRRWRGF
jgi:aminoglycoside phosphotransferase (APT) family kinase protein